MIAVVVFIAGFQEWITKFNILLIKDFGLKFQKWSFTF